MQNQFQHFFCQEVQNLETSWNSCWSSKWVQLVRQYVRETTQNCMNPFWTATLIAWVLSSKSVPAFLLPRGPKSRKNDPRTLQNRSKIKPKWHPRACKWKVVKISLKSYKFNQKIIPKCPKGSPKSLPNPLEIDEKLIQDWHNKQHDFHSPFFNDFL